MTEQEFDTLLNIKTREDHRYFVQSIHYHPYEPTPYRALEILFSAYDLQPSDRVVDFGSGKGRLAFYIHHTSRAKVKGIEMNESLYQHSIDNLESYSKKTEVEEGAIEFHCVLAQSYVIDSLDNRFYFFNPFSIQIFRNIIKNILTSLTTYHREVELILYYCSEEYLHFLEHETPFKLKDKIMIPDLYEHDPCESFFIYTFD